VDAGAGAGAAASVLVVIWPPGRIQRVRRGTTAGDIIRCEGRIEIEDPERPRLRPGDAALVNVNNRLEPASRQLADGDFVVLSPGLLQI
jgi:molybdopterin converting factor small subunit